MNKTKIEWTHMSWNPITGCTPVGAGCDHCYAARMAKRLAGRAGYPTDEPFRVTWHPDRLDEPLHTKKPRRVFCVSMGDFWHPEVPYDYICAVLAVMDQTRQHRYIVLTKRSERQRLNLDDRWGDGVPVPPNLTIGVSCWDQASVDLMVPDLLATPAACRVLSLEPLLGPVVIPNVFSLDGVIVGGETGPGARPLHPDWVRSIRDQCAAAHVPFFFKRWGEWAAEGQPGAWDAGAYDDEDPRVHDWQGYGPEARYNTYSCRCGKTRAGRLLDGREHNALPAALLLPGEEAGQ